MFASLCFLLVLFIEWASVPVYESFVYHVREIDEAGKAGNVVLQHRAGKYRKTRAAIDLLSVVEICQCRDGCGI